MKTRLITAATLAGALAVSVSGAQAGTAVLDGKKVTKITMETTATAQANDAVLKEDLDGKERVACTLPRCARLPFVFKPAKGVTGNLAFTLSWALPGEDYDLYVAELAKDGSATELAHCGASAGTTEKIELGTDSFKAGKTYALIVWNYHATGTQKVTSTVTFPGSAGIKQTVPAAADEAAIVNCGL